MPTDASGVPQISIVLPVYGVQDYLPYCLDSILGQEGTRIEVIAVDDASPDDCGKILDTRAARDQRLRVVHLAANAGPGHARNTGLGLASGEYVWFVDADDTLPPNALPRSAPGWTVITRTCCWSTTPTVTPTAATRRAPARTCCGPRPRVRSRSPSSRS
jgi:glycosyltransferase involved in cell wall biosynthesis